MTRLLLQFKTIVKDKLSILSFLLPLLMAFLFILLQHHPINQLEDIEVGILQENLEGLHLEVLTKISEIRIFQDEEELKKEIQDPSYEMIGLLRENSKDKILLAGDETTRTIEVARSLTRMLDFDLPSNITLSPLPRKYLIDEFQTFIMALIILMSTFIGCVFNSMNIVYEKEKGISKIHEILPFTFKEFIFQKLSIGFILNMLLSILTIVILNLGLYKIIILLPILCLGSFITALIGLYLGSFSQGLLNMILSLKILLLLFLTFPILVYLFFNDVKGKAFFHVIPSYTVFSSLLSILEDNYTLVFFTIILLLIQSIILFFIYKYIYKHKF